MRTTISSAALWRRLLLVGITTLIAMLAVSVSAPDEARAFRDPTIMTSNHVGWVETRPLYGCLALHCPVPTHQAWRWNGSTWSSVRLSGGLQVYVYPYSAPWHWVWTQKTGWLAIQNSALTTGYSCFGPTCPVF
jgi:hypothetical protein